MRGSARKAVAQSSEVVARNALFLGFGQMAITASVAVTGILLVRYFGLVTYGYYAGAVSFIMLFSIVPSFSFNQAFLRQVVLEPQRSSGYLGMTILLTSATMVLFWSLAVAIALARYDRFMVGLIMIVAASSMLQAMLNVLQKVFQARQRMSLIAVTTLANSCVYCVLIVLAIVLRATLVQVALLGLVSAMIGVALTAVVAFRVMRPRLDWEAAGPMLRHGLSFAAMGMLESLAYRAGPFILANMHDLRQVGLYNAAVRIIDMLIVLSNVMMGALLPALYEASADPARMVRAARKTLTIFMVISIPLAAILMGRGQQIIVLLYRKEFAPAGIVLTVFGLSLMFRFTGVLSNSLLYALRRERYLVGVLGGLTVLNVLGSLILGMKYGAIGVAWVTTVVQGLWVCFSLGKANGLLRAGLLGLLPVPIIGAMAMLGILHLMSGWPVLGVAVSLATYALWLMATMYFMPGDLVDLVKSVIGQRLRRISMNSSASMVDKDGSTAVTDHQEALAKRVPRRIGFHVRGDEGGGVAMVTTQLASELVRLGREVHFFANESGRYLENLRSIGQVHLLNIPRPNAWSRKIGGVRLPNPLALLSEFRRLRTTRQIVLRVLAEHPVDVIIGNGHMSVRAIGQACRLSGVPQVTWVHGRVGLEPTGLGLSLKLTRHYLRQSRKVVGVSHAVLEYVVGCRGIDATVIHNCPMPRLPTLPEARRVFRERYAIPHDAFVVGSLGRMDPDKAYDRLIEAVLILRQGGRDLYAVVAGEPTSQSEGDFYRSLRGRVADCPLLQGRVVFPGLVNGADFFPALDVFVHIYLRTEGLSLAVLEALDAGVPAIVSDRGGPVEIVSSSEYGVVTRTEDPHLLALSIQRLMDDPDYVRRLRLNGPRRIREAFDPSTWGQRWLDLLAGVTGIP